MEPVGHVPESMRAYVDNLERLYGFRVQTHSGMPEDTMAIVGPLTRLDDPTSLRVVKLPALVQLKAETLKRVQDFEMRMRADVDDFLGEGAYDRLMTAVDDKILGGGA
jgi:hypothetical protein